MLRQKITVLVQTTVAGPDGFKLMPGKVVELEDDDYTRLLVKSGTVSLIDPPSLDPDFLAKNGYETQEGDLYDELKISEEKQKKARRKTKVQKNVEPIDSEEQHSDVVSEESSQEKGAVVEEETPEAKGLKQ